MPEAGENEPQPLFVLGIQRSGTTWLANLLSGHSEIRAVEAATHQGVHESIFFSHFARAHGDLANDENFERFARAFTACDYFLLTGIEPDWLYERRPRSYAECFQALMDEYTRRSGGAAYWLEKSPDHTALADDLARDFPNARFVCITRRSRDVIWSRFWMRRESAPPLVTRIRLLVRFAAASIFHQRWLLRFSHSHRGRVVTTTYESLKQRTDSELGEILRFLELPFEREMTKSRYAPNTSFRSGRARALTPLDRVTIQLVSLALYCVPLSYLRRVFRRRRERRGVEWPAWCWQRRDTGLT